VCESHVSEAFVNFGLDTFSKPQEDHIL